MCAGLHAERCLAAWGAPAESACLSALLFSRCASAAPPAAPVAIKKRDRNTASESQGSGTLSCACHEFEFTVCAPAPVFPRFPRCLQRTRPAWPTPLTTVRVWHAGGGSAVRTISLRCRHFARHMLSGAVFLCRPRDPRIQAACRSVHSIFKGCGYGCVTWTWRCRCCVQPRRGD